MTSYSSYSNVGMSAQSPEATPTGASGVSKLKRAFVGRRKNKSVELDVLTLQNNYNVSTSSLTTPRPPNTAAMLGTFGSVFGRKPRDQQPAQQHSQPPRPPTIERDMPPPLPPKLTTSREPVRDERAAGTEGERSDWRKSNATSASGNTIRPFISTTNLDNGSYSSTNSAASGRENTPSDVSSISFSTTTSSQQGWTSDAPTPTSPPTSPTSLRRVVKRSFTGNVGGMISDTLKGKHLGMLRRAASPSSSTTELGERTAPSSFRTPAQSPSSPPPPSSWPPMQQSSDAQQARGGSQNKLRSTATSLTNTTLGFGKKAVEKMQMRGWGGSLQSGIAGAAYSSSSSSSSSLVNSENRRDRRVPNLPVESGSINSLGSGGGTSSGSDSEAMDHRIHNLGVLLREPRQSGALGGGRGLVFGRDLVSCVRETKASTAVTVGEAGVNRKLEERMIPALLLRCAVHLHKYGLEEEGLFRISGRSTHIQRLKAEFDSGADWDLSDCSPADIDPHAVASVFKTYFRELPEPILTRSLANKFDAALSAEQTALSLMVPQKSQAPTTGAGRSGPSLPSDPRPRPQMIKPPSREWLSTIPAPSGSPPPKRASGPSDNLIQILASLVSCLPPENHDVLQTVTELIRETARRSKFTKMPLSNLLLLFCPSLNMSPGLLRLLCECEEVWTKQQLDEVYDISPESGHRSSTGTGPRPQKRRNHVPAELEGSFSDSGGTPSVEKTPTRTRSQSTSHLSPRSSEDVEAIKGSRRRSRTIEAISPLAEGKEQLEAETPLPELPGSASASTAALVTLPPETVSEWYDAEGGEEDDEADESRRHTIVARDFPSPSTTHHGMSSSSSESYEPSLGIDGAEPSFSSMSSVAPPSETGHEDDSDMASYRDSMHILRQMKAISESEVRRARSASMYDIGPHPTPLRHRASLNLLHVKQISDPVTPVTSTSLPTPTSGGENRIRLPTKLALRIRRRSTDLASLIRSRSISAPLSSPVLDSAPSFPPSLSLLPFEADRSSPFDLTPFDKSTGTWRTSTIGPEPLSPTTKHRRHFSRSRSSPLLKSPTKDRFNLEPAPSPLNKVDTDRTATPTTGPIIPARQEPAGAHQDLTFPITPPPTLSLAPNSPTEADWVQSVLLAADSSSLD